MIIIVVVVIVAVQLGLKLESLRFRSLVTFGGLLSLILDLSLRRLHLFVLDHITCFDNVGNRSIVKNILGFLNDLLQKCSCQVNLAVFLRGTRASDESRVLLRI